MSTRAHTRTIHQTYTHAHTTLQSAQQLCSVLNTEVVIRHVWSDGDGFRNPEEQGKVLKRNYLIKPFHLFYIWKVDLQRSTEHIKKWQREYMVKTL